MEGRSQIAYLVVVTNKKRICIVGPTSGSADAIQAAFGGRIFALGSERSQPRPCGTSISVRLPTLIAFRLPRPSAL
jgi:hypothetical protein